MQKLLLFLLFISTLLIILYVYTEKDIGYKKVLDIRQYTLYVKPNDITDVIFVTKDDEYLIKNQNYIFKDRWKTITLKEALLQEVITLDEALEYIPEIIIKPKGFYKIGQIGFYSIYQKEDTNTSCASTIDYFFIDDTNEYYFNCPLNDDYLVNYQKVNYSLTEALEKKIVTIHELMEIIKPIQARPIQYDVIGTINNIDILKTTCFYETGNKIEIIYEDDKNVYYFTSLLSQFYKVNKDDEYYTLQVALSQDIVTIDELRLIIPGIKEL